MDDAIASPPAHLSHLPPLKRLRLQHQQQHHHSPLPAKKRKESRNAPPFRQIPNPPPPPHVYSLPAKKRVWAPHPISSSEEDEEIQHQQFKEVHDNVDDDDEDDGILCCVCQSTDGDPADPIVLCDGCDLMVHASCYGNPLASGVPEGDWFCERCRGGRRGDDGGRCCLCPMKEGAMKRTTDGRWAHIVCALLVPEVFFSDPEGREGIDCSEVPAKRWLSPERCYLCNSREGCAIVCSEEKCSLAFHITCGLREDLCIEYKEGSKKKKNVVAGFCKIHTQLWEKQQESGKYKIVAIEDKK